ncbi:MAG: DUF1801 domain-containing protein [Nitrospirales bacterium]
MNVEEYIDSLDSPMKEISSELRRIVTVFSPELKEEVKWSVPTYSINKNICSIIAHKKHVNFQIMQGAHIKDAEELEGTGKDMRHLKFSTLGEVEKTNVQKYLKQAISVDK